MTPRAVAKMSQQGSKITRGGHIFKYNVGCMRQPPRKSRLWHVKFIHIYLFISTQKVIQIWTPNLLSTVNWCFATWTRAETRNSTFCKHLKLLSACRLSSLFTYAPRLLFHVSRNTAYQAVRHTAEIMQVDDTTWQLKHKSRKNVILWTSPSGANFLKEWFWLISGISIALLSVTHKSFSIPRAECRWCDAPRLIQL